MLPRINYADSYGKDKQTAFGGLDRRLGAKDGAIAGMENMTADHFPVLSNRPKRYKVKTLTKANGFAARDALLWVDGTGFYYDGVRKGTVEDSKKRFCFLNYYVLIWPDKLYYRVGSKGVKASKADLPAAGEYGELWSVGKTAPYDLYWWDGDTWDYLMPEFGPLEQRYSGSVRFRDGSYAGESAAANTIYAKGVDWADYFAVNEAVRIKSASNDLTLVIREIDGEELRFYENSFTNTEEACTITRFVPEMDFLLENGNRLWGCKGDTIYCSALGNPKVWEDYDNLSTGSWSCEVGSAGDFTGCVSYGGYPLFFKEDHIYRVYGRKPSAYQVEDSSDLGLERGSADSFAIAGQVLYYKSRAGFCAYAGGVPVIIDEALGGARLSEAVGGSDGVKYYVSVKNGDGYELLTYCKGMWHREDATRAEAFGWSGELYFLSGNHIWMTGRVRTAPDGEEDEVLSWVEFADCDGGTMSRKELQRILLRCEGRVTARIRYDGGRWEECAGYTGKKTMHTLELIPRRCDHFQLRLEGRGDWKLYMLAREYGEGSDMP